MSRVYRAATLLVAVSNYTKNIFLQKHGPIRTPVIVNHNGLSFGPEICEKESKNLTVLSVCRQTNRKNLTTALGAVLKAIESGTSLEYHLVGTGSQHQTLRTMIERSRYENKIHLHGHLSDQEIEDLYKKADVVLHPQRELLEENDMEGFGLVIADGMAKGCIPIIGNNGGAMEIVEPNINGYRVEPFDQEAIKAHLENISRCEPLRESLSRNPTLYSRRFSWLTHAERIHNAMSDYSKNGLRTKLQFATPKQKNA